jgi:hypothetical protein
VHPHNLGKVTFTVKKTPAGFNVTIRPFTGELLSNEPAPDPEAPRAAAEPLPSAFKVEGTHVAESSSQLPSEAAATIEFEAVRSNYSDIPTAVARARRSMYPVSSRIPFKPRSRLSPRRQPQIGCRSSTVEKATAGKKT